MTSVSPGPHPSATDGAATELVTVRVPTLRADEYRRRAHRRERHPRASRQHARRTKADLVGLGLATADAAGRPLLGRSVPVRRQDVRRWARHRTGRARVRAPSLVAVAEHVPAASRAGIDQRVGLEAEGRLQPLEHVIGTLAQRHPRRELGLPRVEHSRRSCLRHARETECQPKLVSFLGGQTRLTQGTGASWPRTPSNPRGQCRGPGRSARAQCDECEPLERPSPSCRRPCVRVSGLLAYATRVPWKTGQRHRFRRC
jgi:hypothetical protein